MYRDKPTKEHLLSMASRNLKKFINYVSSLHDSINYYVDQVHQLAARIDYLEKQLAKDSSNSSKPPSTDGFKRVRKTKSMRKKSGKKPGGQPGHKCSTLKMVDEPNEIVSHTLEECPICKLSLKDTKPSNTERRQVFDIPLPTIIVTEHQTEVKQCPN